MFALRPRPIALTLLAGAALCAAPPDTLAQGCAMCASAVGSDDGLGRALNSSILFMLATPYVTLAVVGGWLYVNARRRRNHRADVIDLPWGRQAPTAPRED